MRDAPRLNRFATYSVRLPGTAGAMLLPVWDAKAQRRSSTAAMPARFTRLIQEIGKGHDSYRLTGIDDYQTPDRMTSHQVRGLVD